jgi:hypothetical protein
MNMTLTASVRIYYPEIVEEELPITYHVSPHAFCRWALVFVRRLLV